MNVNKIHKEVNFSKVFQTISCSIHAQFEACNTEVEISDFDGA
jgi:hypothetical protein